MALEPIQSNLSRSWWVMFILQPKKHPWKPGPWKPAPFNSGARNGDRSSNLDFFGECNTATWDAFFSVGNLLLDVVCRAATKRWYLNVRKTLGYKIVYCEILWAKELVHLSHTFPEITKLFCCFILLVLTSNHVQARIDIFSPSRLVRAIRCRSTPENDEEKRHNEILLLQKCDT